MLERYRAIQAEVGPRSGRLVAVSKGQPFDKIAELYRAGHRDFGENYVQEMAEKAALAASAGLVGIRWHFLWHLQTNKVKQLLGHVFMIHSVDSRRLAEEISKRAMAAGLKVPVLIEVNVDAQESKSGVAPEGLGTLITEIASLPGIEIRGLMCIPSREGGLTGEAFRYLRALRDEYQTRLGPGELSMGMSEDYPVALREGATWVRVGTALFGPRNT